MCHNIVIVYPLEMTYAMNLYNMFMTQLWSIIAASSSKVSPKSIVTGNPFLQLYVNILFLIIIIKKKKVQATENIDYPGHYD